MAGFPAFDCRMFMGVITGELSHRRQGLGEQSLIWHHPSIVLTVLYTKLVGGSIYDSTCIQYLLSQDCGWGNHRKKWLEKNETLITKKRKLILVI